jgi:hypothetical protein
MENLEVDSAVRGGERERERERERSVENRRQGGGW